MGSKIHLFFDTARNQVLAARLFEPLKILIKTHKISDKNSDIALQRLGLKKRVASIFDSPNLIVATNNPENLATWIQWNKTNKPPILREKPQQAAAQPATDTLPATPATSATSAMPATDTLPAMPATSAMPALPATSATLATPPQTKNDITTRIEQFLTNKTRIEQTLKKA